MTSNLQTLYDSSLRLVADIQRFLDIAEPVLGSRPMPTAQWYPELQDACSQAHLLWSRLEELQRSTNKEDASNRP